MKIVDVKIQQFHVPRKMIFRDSFYEIVEIDRKYHIKGYTVKTVDDKIDMVILNCPHPNANPKNGEFCIPHSLRKEKLNETTLDKINNMIVCFNLDDCYFTPWHEIKYEKMEVLGTWQKN